MFARKTWVRVIDMIRF